MKQPTTTQEYVCVFIDACDGTGQCYQCGKTRSDHYPMSTPQKADTQFTPRQCSVANVDGRTFVKNGTGQVVAQVYGDAAQSGLERSNLYAAAPDLLEALQDLVTYADVNCDHDDTADMRQAARAAIARATAL